MSELRPYYDPSTFDAGYPVSYRPGLGVIYSSGQSIVDTIFSNNNGAKKAANLGIAATKRNVTSTRTSSSVIDSTESVWKDTPDAIQGFFQKLARSYFKVILNQPFDLIRLLLQVAEFETVDSELQNNSLKPLRKYKTKHRKTHSDAGDSADFYFRNDSSATTASDDADQDLVSEDDYEDSALKSRRHADASGLDSDYIVPLSLHSVDIMSALLAKEGTTSLWKATNISYIYQALVSTLQSWLTGFFSPFLEIPDPFYIDVSYSPDPMKSIALIILAATATGIILAPLDLIRTKLIVTKTGPNRSLRSNISRMENYFCPIQLVFPTMLNCFCNNVIKNITPLLLFKKSFLGSFTSGGSSYSGTSYEAVKLLSEVLELSVKLPTETILRRAQMSYLLNKSQNLKYGDSNGLEITNRDTVVKFKGYNGVFDTIFGSIGNTFSANGDNSNGVKSLYKGWRIGILTIFARWGFNALNSDSKFVEEQF